MNSWKWLLPLRALALCVLALAVSFVWRDLRSSAGQTPRNPGAMDQSSETVLVDLTAPAHPFPHFWEQMFGSGRATLSLRDSYRRDLRETKNATDFKYVRFHAILDDDVGLYGEDSRGSPTYNFSYVDQIYDGLLANGVRPFVELSFMPSKLAAAQTFHSFWYKPIVSPPASYEKWGQLISHLAQHLVDRYGIDEVSQWYFEVWNEPNIDFWAGDPKQKTYFELYDAAARAIKSVSSRMRVGGPSTAQAAWVDAFLAHVKEAGTPVDFVSTHVYANDTSMNVFGTQEDIPRDQMVCRATRKVHEQVKSSSQPKLPVIFSEYNATYMTETEITDSEYMGPWLADTIRQCDGLVDMLSYWTFSDVFEEQGVIQQPFYGGYGLIGEGGVAKPAFNAFKILHKLGDQRIANDSHSALVTRRAGGKIVAAVWNLQPPKAEGPARQFTVKLAARAGEVNATIYRVDASHGSPLRAYAEMGKPAFPTSKQFEELRRASELPQPETKAFAKGELKLTVPAHGLAVIEFEP